MSRERGTGDIKVLLYLEGMKLIARSGIGRAIEHQKQALRSAGISFTTDPAEEVDLLHVNTYFPKSYLQAKRMKRRGIPVIYHAHSTKEDFKNSFLFSNNAAPLFGWWITKCYNAGDVVITPTSYAKSLLIKSGVKRPIFVVSNGIDLSYYRTEPTERGNRRRAFRERYGYSEEDKVIMSVGHYIKRKGILDFVELAKRMPDHHFIWFGYTNPAQVPLEIRRAVETELPNLRFPGYVTSEELREAYAGADVFFFPTYEETEGIVLLEAMAMEQNIVVRDIPIYQEEWQDGVTVYKGRDLTGFQELIEKVTSGELPSLREAARRKVADWSIEQIGWKLAEIYQFALSQKQRADRSSSENLQ